MSKFLRQIEFRGFLRQATYDETESNLLEYFKPHPNDSYWLCTTEGAVEFHFGLADSDSAHHVYRNACILIDGSGVIPDRERGMLLLGRAAAMGYKHAQRRLGRYLRTFPDNR